MAIARRINEKKGENIESVLTSPEEMGNYKNEALAVQNSLSKNLN